MHSPKKKVNLSRNTHQTEHVQSVFTQYFLSGDKSSTLEEESEKSGSNRVFTQCKGLTP
ncbi:unnamed protein product [Staurois parvus]|uniref:Uncharacterized protein n=1 Tax=Staurois parvus TaxID=386267 RepID=A0ABN9C524_9NEOB|nr:unnamed protein product [Staurois parvus]